MKTYERATILHPRSNRIKARSPSCRATVMQQWTMSYPLVALHFLICHPQRTTWRLNQERRPYVVPAIPSVARIAEYGENSAESNNSRSSPPKMCPRWGVASSLSFMYPTFRVAPAPHMPTSITVRGPEDMLSSPLGQHILSYEPSRGFIIQSFAMYDGSSDPYDHMLHFNKAMILNAGDDRLLCKVFPTSLKGPALAWFHKLPRRSINS